MQGFNRANQPVLVLKGHGFNRGLSKLVLQKIAEPNAPLPWNAHLLVRRNPHPFHSSIICRKSRNR
jgi:hypothetical protein